MSNNIKFMELSNKNILITGGTGSFGNYFVEKILSEYNPSKLVIYSRDELKQHDFNNKLKSKFSEEFLQNKVRFFLGDVRDKERLNLAMQGIDIVIHAAALKQVPAAEYNPMETIKTNILGAQNLIDVVLQHENISVIALSTDKAANPINLYGATKLASDKLFIAANNLVGNKNILFSVVRYGNVFGSRGSVVPYYLSLLKSNENTFPVTDERMTRFWITLEEAVDFVIKTISIMKGGEIFVPKIPSVNILDVVKAINPQAKIKIVGIRPGEKLHEVMCPRDEYFKVIEFNKFFIISPSVLFSNNNLDFFKLADEVGKKVSDDFEYNSFNNEKFLTIDEIKNYLKLLQV